MGILSLVLGLVRMIILGIGLLTNLEPLIWGVVVLALAGLFPGLTALVKQQQRISAWTGVACSGLALVSGSIAYGIGHGLG